MGVGAKCYTRYIFAIAAMLVFVVCEFKSQPAVLAPILSGLGGGVAGFFGGVGYAKKTQK